MLYMIDIIILQTELSSLQGISSDSAKLLAEKLALSRELANIQPEVEHLRSQVTSHKSLLSEKLSLERQLSTTQMELENEKHALHQISQKVERTREKETDHRTEIEELRKELSSQRREGEKISTALRDAEEELKSKRNAAKVAAARDEKNEAKQERETEELRKELAKEKRHTQEAEKALRGAQSDWEIEKSALEERLSTVRTKLKSHKEQLKKKDEELRQAQHAINDAAKNTNVDGKRGAKNSRKREIQHIDPDAAIGTPGIPIKRNKRASTAQPGDKSTFSITPFLNKTTGAAPSSPASGQSIVSRAGTARMDEVVDSIENEQSPTVPTKNQTAKSKSSNNPRALAPMTCNKPTSKRAPLKTAAPPRLEKVAEEDDQENMDEEAEVTQPLVPAKVPKITLKPKLTTSRRSLMSFSSFNEDGAPEKRKKRKLGGANAANKTLFDDDDRPSLKPVSGKGLLAAKAIGRSGLLAKGAGKQGSRVLEDGFIFSPLKKDRRAVAAN